jgi:geranylgeranyl reductase family protein
MPDVTVVGAGPAGSAAAKEAAKLGKKVVMLEEHAEVGVPCHCTGLVSIKGLDLLEVDYSRIILNKCRGARLFSPNNTEIEVKKPSTTAYVLDRVGLDKQMAEEAESEGVEVRKGVRGEVAKTGITVAADGSASGIARSLGVKREHFLTYQIFTEHAMETDFVELHFGPFAPGFFAWAVPVDEKHARVGIGVSSGNPKQAFDAFCKARGLGALKALSIQAGPIPVFDGQQTVFDSVALVGDAAAQVKATTGGGIAIGGFCGRILGQVIGRDLPLSEYESAWRAEYERDLELHLRMRRFADRLSWQEMDELFVLARDNGLVPIIEQYGEMEKITPMINPLMNAVMQNPKLLNTGLKYLGRF